ncbi:UDP-N-acetylmuramoyl-L-alanyl-D-glutamate--2,6-diaminopimelate ligase [Hyphobacterium sp. CCMP332]|nr:UDP-N-acetylmuramoyl-L-alanyl-D-glutamate--2,6-diaminopimelate ligase [Hyphobacterium sp. CCMP332]
MKASLKDILYKVSLVGISGDTSVGIDGLTLDSRKVKKGFLFAALKGTQSDGHDFIQKAIANGAIAILCEDMPEKLSENTTYIQVNSASKALAIVASNYFGKPSSKLKLVAVTGTNGKTTCASLSYQLFRSLGYNAGLLSTIKILINEEEIEATHTTPDVIRINELMAEMVKKGCTHCFMEASSHALVQDRTFGLDIDIAVFTNISRDHLDYHKTFDAYIEAKKILFDNLSTKSVALINKDDKRGMVMVQNSRADVKTFSLQRMADFKAKILSNTFQGLELDIDGQVVWFGLIGDFNAYNLLCIYAIAVLLEEQPEDILENLSSLNNVEGRFERLISEEGIFAIVDYAHTPDALENVLNTIKKVRNGNEMVITVIGCGGNRDKGKRPIMANIACKLSDKVIFTSDNPRDEDPMLIINEMEKGVSPTDLRKTLKQVDRFEAIKTAYSLAEKGDIILVAGKGHETYQEIKGIRNHFDDRESLKQIFELNKSRN